MGFVIWLFLHWDAGWREGHIHHEDDCDYEQRQDAPNYQFVLKAGFLDCHNQAVRLHHVFLHTEEVLHGPILKFVTLRLQVKLDVSGHLVAFHTHLFSFFQLRTILQ